MAYDERLANRVRKRISELPEMYEKELMGGLVFIFYV
jgi:hypothetical protein